MFSIFRTAPTVLTAGEAEQWLFRHDQYLAQHQNKEPNLDHYFDETVAANEQFREKFPVKTPEAIRRAVILVFQEALAKSWLEYQDAEWSIDLASRNPQINITEVYPGSAKFERDERRDKIRQLLAALQKRRDAEALKKQQEAEQASLQSRTVVVQVSPSESVRPVQKQPDRLVLIKQWYEGATDINIEQLCPNLKRIDPSGHREVVRQYLVQQGVLQDLPPPSGLQQEERASIYPSPLVPISLDPRQADLSLPLRVEEQQTEKDSTVVPSDVRPQVYPTLPPQLVQQVARDPYIPSKPLASTVEIGEVPKEPVVKRSAFSFFRRAEPAVQIPQLNTKELEQALTKAISQKEDIGTAATVYIDGVRALIPAECSAKQRIAIFEQAIAKALKIKCDAYGYEYYLRTRAFTSVLWDAAPILRAALLDPDQDAALVINALLAVKEDLAKLHKTPYPEFVTPEKLFISYALFGNEQPQLFPFMGPLRTLQEAYQRAKEAGAEPALLNSIRHKWSQWAWAVEKIALIRLPADLYKSPEPVDFVAVMQEMHAQQFRPSAPPMDDERQVVITPQNVLRLRREARAKRREEIAAMLSRLEQGQDKKPSQQLKATGSQKPKKAPVVEDSEEVVEVSPEKIPEASRFTKSYIEVLFEGREPRGIALKRESFGLRYRLYKLAVLEKEANPWSSALWDHEESIDRNFSATYKISQMERQVVKPYIAAYRDQPLIKAIHQVVRAVEAGYAPDELHEVIGRVPGHFYQNEVFRGFLASQAEAESEVLDPEMNNTSQSPIIAQAMVAWFDNRLSAFAKLKKIS